MQTRERKGCERGATRNFLQSFPLSSAPVVQSYWSPIDLSMGARIFLKESDQDLGCKRTCCTRGIRWHWRVLKKNQTQETPGCAESWENLNGARKRGQGLEAQQRYFSYRAILVQKNPRVHKIFVRNSGDGYGCANFMGTWKNCVLSAGKPMSINSLVLGGGGILGFGGGRECRFYFYGRADFSDL